MKRIISLFLCLIFSLSLVSCVKIDEHNELNNKHQNHQTTTVVKEEKFNKFYCDSIDFDKYEKKSLDNLRLYDTFKLPFDINEAKKYVVAVGSINESNSTEPITDIFDSYFAKEDGVRLKDVAFAENGEANGVNFTINDNSCKNKKFNWEKFNLNFIVKATEIENAIISDYVKNDKYYITLDSETLDNAFEIYKYEDFRDKDFFNTDKLMLLEILSKLGKPNEIKTDIGEVRGVTVVNDNGTAHGKSLTKTNHFIYKTSDSVIEIVFEEEQSIAKKIDYINSDYKLSTNIYSKNSYELKLNSLNIQ